ncbi:hypothetical protein Tco_0091747, partial [Tanacetum coccineum]
MCMPGKKLLKRSLLASLWWPAMLASKEGFLVLLSLVGSSIVLFSCGLKVLPPSGFLKSLLLLPVIIEQRVKVNQKARILELKRRNHKIYCFGNLYAVSIKEDTAYPCPNFTVASTNRISIRRIQKKAIRRIQYETDKALRNGKVYNWETATYGKISYDEDVHYLRLFKTEFPARVYDEALTSKLEFSSEPTASPQHVDELNWKNKISLSEYNDEEYNVIFHNDLFYFNIISVNELKLDTDSDNDKIDIKQSSGDISIEPLRNVISIDVGLNMTYPETWIWRIDFMNLLNEMKNLVILLSGIYVCCSHTGIQTDLQHTSLLMITTARRVSTVRRIKTREMIKMKIVYQDYLRDKRNLQEELFTHKEEMDLETTQTTTTTKLPILKQENGNSFKPLAQTTNVDGTSTLLIPGPVTTEENAQKKNDVKARSIFGSNYATKKTQKTLLKQMYENFSAPSTESLDSIFNRLQKIWNTYVVVWRNKPDLDTMSFDDLYNNFKIVEQEVKGTASSSSSSQNMAFVSSLSSTNEVNTTYGVSSVNTQVSPASTQVSTASTQVSTANLSDDTIYAFLASQPNRSQLVYEDLEQFHKDDIEEMDLKWQLALLSIRTRRFFQKTGRKITINGSDTAGYDKSKVECFNCTYKRGLASIEEQLVYYKKNEVIFYEQLAVLKREISYKDSEISMLENELENLKQEKESNQLKIENFNNASKSLYKLIGRLFSPPKFDLSNSGLEEFQQPEFEGYGPNPSKSVSECEVSQFTISG